MLSQIVVTAAIFILCPFLAIAQQMDHANIEEYKWKNRLLLVFAPDADNDMYRQQAALLEGKEAGMKDRDMKIFSLIGNGSAAVDEKPVPKGQVQRLANKYDVDSGGFAVILIGKDGTEKLRQNKPLKTEKLFSVIDAMPMRQNEMRENND